MKFFEFVLEFVFVSLHLCLCDFIRMHLDEIPV